MITGTSPSEEDTSSYSEKTIVIQKIEKIDIEGNTWLFVVDEENHIYKARYADVLEMIMFSEGDTVTILTDGNVFKITKHELFK